MRPRATAAGFHRVNEAPRKRALPGVVALVRFRAGMHARGAERATRHQERKERDQQREVLHGLMERQNPQGEAVKHARRPCRPRFLYLAKPDGNPRQGQQGRFVVPAWGGGGKAPRSEEISHESCEGSPSGACEAPAAVRPHRPPASAEKPLPCASGEPTPIPKCLWVLVSQWRAEQRLGCVWNKL